jgi:dTDP-4-amino-4,6-dideoxygalactose transaminase
MNKGIRKHGIEDLALFGGISLFSSPKPTSNLVRPNSDHFFDYLIGGLARNDGALVNELERRLAALHNVEHCVAFNSGFWALALLIDALSLPGKDEIILPSLTYRRMADIVAWVGRTPHFCDIERHSLANSANTVQPCINADTALIIGVHPVGGHCDIDGLSQLATERGIPLIFDSVESVHEMHRERHIGTFGDAELFSLGASKLLNGFEGGYITTNNAELAANLRLKREGKGPGLNLSAPLPEIHAAMTLAGLDDLPSQLERNLARFDRYRHELTDLPELRLIEQDPATEPSHKNIVIEVLDTWPYTRDQTIQLLNAEKILARAYYAPPLTHKPISYPHIAGALPNTDWVAMRFISLPCGHLVSLDDINLIVAYLRYIKRHAKTILVGIAEAPSSS